MDTVTVKQIVSSALEQAGAGNPWAIAAMLWMAGVATLVGGAWAWDKIWWHRRQAKGEDPLSSLAASMDKSHAAILDAVGAHAQADGNEHRTTARTLEEVATSVRELAAEIRESRREGARERAEIKRETAEYITELRIEVAKLAKGAA